MAYVCARAHTHSREAPAAAVREQTAPHRAVGRPRCMPALVHRLAAGAHAPGGRPVPMRAASTTNTRLPQVAPRTAVAVSSNDVGEHGGADSGGVWAVTDRTPTVAHARCARAAPPCAHATCIGCGVSWAAMCARHTTTPTHTTHAHMAPRTRACAAPRPTTSAGRSVCTPCARVRCNAHMAVVADESSAHNTVWGLGTTPP